MRTKPFIIILILWVTAIVIIALMTRPAAAQAGCSVRTDWPTYTVVRGDTLYLIARRYNATTTILATANCLTNSNRIYVGQVLRVPGAGGGATLTPIPNANRPITFQPYESGYLLWWADTGEIWELTGVQSGTLTVYPSRSYGGLPENPVRDATPPNRVRPIMGFGRLWGNFAHVWGQLGWATAPEQSFISTLIYNAANRSYTFTVPGGRTLYSDGQTWNIFTGTPPTIPPPPPPTITPLPEGSQSVPASYQAFEHGFMIWRADTGEITVYFGNNGGGVSVFPSVSYGRLPDNTINNPPLGYYSPILGMGKVWGNFPNVRSQLGWATTFELSYSMLIQTDGTPGGFKFIIPSGRTYIWVINDRNRTWAYTTAPDLNGAALPAAAQAVVPPTPTSPPPSTPVPEANITTNAAYETFEHGFMIWRADTGDIWVFPMWASMNYFGQFDYENLPDNPVTETPPDARLSPVNGFGRVWGNIEAIRSALGWAIDAEQSYPATLHPIQVMSPDGVKSIPGFCFNLPDGRTVQFPDYVNETTLTWRFVESCG